MHNLITVLFISVVIFIGILIISFLYVFSNGAKLSTYLKTHNYERWRYLTSIGSFGPSLSNPVRGLSYIYGQQDNNDEKILRYKDAVRSGLGYCALTLGAIVIQIALLGIMIKFFYK